MKESTALALATLVITTVRIGIGYVAAWIAEDSKQPAKETADNK